MIRKVSFKNSKGQKIVGLLNIPRGRGPFPAVVICHGFKGYKEQGHLKTLATALAKAGFVTLRFDFTNEVGGSFGKFEDSTFSQRLKDLKSAIDYLLKQGFVDPKRLGLAGHSLGGQVILTYTPTDKRVKALVDLAGVTYRGKGDTSSERSLAKQLTMAKKTGYIELFSKRTGKKHRIKTGYYDDLFKHDTPAAIKKIKAPCLIIHGAKDKTVSLKHPKLAYKLLQQSKKLVIVPGMPHTWRGNDDPNGKYQKKVNPLVVDWFGKYLPR